MKDMAEARADQIVKEATASKAAAYDVSGMDNAELINRGISQIRDGCQRMFTCSNVDDDYLLVASHVEAITREKIMNNESIDFAKLIHKDKYNEDEGGYQKMQMVNKGGVSYWVPLTDKINAIYSYPKWDQAFSVFLDIYTSRFPGKTSELIQYSHIIHTASMSHSWDNVYLYDREFCRHIERHPERNWGVFLQQAWTMFLKDRINATPNSKFGVNNGSNNNAVNGEHRKSGVSRKLCIPFNVTGECRFGTKCRFDHCCGFCGRFGHGTYNCRKALNIKTTNGSPATEPTSNSKFLTNS